MATAATSITNRIRTRLGRRMHEALTFMVATAWAELFDDLFIAIAGEQANMLMRLVHAFSFTVFAVLITLLFEGDDED